MCRKHQNNTNITLKNNYNLPKQQQPIRQPENQQIINLTIRSNNRQNKILNLYK